MDNWKKHVTLKREHKDEVLISVGQWISLVFVHFV